MERKKPMKSDNTFQQEFEFLLNHVPGSLDFQSEQTTPELVEGHFNNNLADYIIDASNVKIDRLPDNSIDDLLNEEQFVFKNSMDVNFPSITNIAQESQLSNGLAQNLFLNFGSEAFGLYLPMHSFYRNTFNPWGIYLFPEVIGPHVTTLHETFKCDLREDNLLRFYIWCVYRHELFHFHTESFSTGQEVLNRKPLYLKYRKDIYEKYMYSEHLLEEALAEASVLSSRLVAKRIRIDSALRRRIYKYDLDQMPPGYRDYHCRSYGGPKEAHRHFAAQLIHQDNKDPIPTLLNTVKNEFIRNDKNVPVYMVRGLREIKRIQ